MISGQGEETSTGVQKMTNTTVRLILPDGTIKEAKAESVSIKTGSNEQWSEYPLEDGSVIRARPIVSKVLKTDEFDADGNPIYQVSVATVIFVDVPDYLKRKKT